MGGKSSLCGLAIMVLMISLAVSGQDVEQPAKNEEPTVSPITIAPPKPTTTEVPTTTTKATTTTKPTTTTTTTTTPKPTTTSTPTTTTPEPITTTTPEPITTPKPTTPTTTTTSTPKPTTTSTVAPITTTSKPKPDKPEEGMWRVNYTEAVNANVSCIVAGMALELDVPYTTKDNKNLTARVYLPVTAEASGSCGNDVQTMILKWEKNSVSFFFKKDNTSYGLSQFMAFIEPDSVNFPDAAVNKPIALSYTSKVFNSTENKSYRCDEVQALNLSSTVSGATLKVSSLHLQAFYNSTGSGFQDAVNCRSLTPDIVPIAAGCALAALIILVLGGYLWGRRRSQARGYLSM